jgi:hypothetical protein
MSEPDTRFSTVRLEMPCHVMLAAAMAIVPLNAIARRTDKARSARAAVAPV